ncbi:MAG: MotA/TolQ/ExbB proton channel family protein [Verrucomicrobiota bacterium]|nr:MotA/TolQ/ExbB proton channel family protein [Verrucomicrobiota bacterium]
MRSLIFNFLLSASFLVYSVNGQNLAQANSSAKQDLQNATTRLRDLRKSIEDEKIPLASEIGKLEREAQEKRSEVDRLIRIRDNRDANLIELKEEVKEGDNEIESIRRILADYSRSWSESTPPAERSVLKKIVIDNKFSQPTSRKKQIQSLLKIASTSANFLQMQATGIRFPGNAIVPPEGTREEGTFWSIGPFIYFAGERGSAGLVEKHSPTTGASSIELSSGGSFPDEPARLIPSSPETAILIRQTLKSESGSLGILPLDPTMGKASVLEVGELTFIEELQKGGIWIYPILFFACLSVLIAIFKSLQIFTIKSPQGPVTLAGFFSGPFERLRKTAQGYRGNKPEILEEILYEIIIDCQERLEKGLPLVAITAAIAPLLGLLGTVTGMIDVFRQITNFANPENSELARGISEALVTTKFGLVTAIPALVIHALLNRRLQGLVSKMEGFSARLVHLKKENPTDLKIEKKDESAD